MIALQSVAPDFTLTLQNGKPFRLSDWKGKAHVLLLFLPAAFTPICTTELPALAALRNDFWRDAGTVVAAVTVDNIHSNREWGRDCKTGPLFILSDFYPHGAVSQAYGAYLYDEGISDRATVIVGKDGLVRYAESVGKFGKRSIPALLDIARAIDGRAPLNRKSAKMPLDLPVLFVSRSCPHCAEATQALQMLQLETRIVVRYVDDSPEALKSLLSISNEGSVPTLFWQGKTYVGSPQVIAALRKISGK